jgi:large subunit ribosomal protein L4
MKVSVKTLENKSAGDITLADSVFGIEPRADIMARVVNWQLAKRRAGTHKVQLRSEITRSGSKMYRQKGTGRARHGSGAANIFRGGGVAHGPVIRDHGYSLQKKVRALGLRSALSSKARDGKLIVIDDLKANGKTSGLKGKFSKLGLANALIIGGSELDEKFQRAAGNIPNIDVLPQQGANVYDILRRDVLVLTKDSAAHLEERLK